MNIETPRKRIPFTLLITCLSSFLFICLSVSSYAQKNAIRFQLDNDWFTDQYYTAGLELTYHRSLNRLPGLLRNVQANQSLNWTGTYGFKIFTPNVYDEKSFNDMSQDRPFAGYQYLGLGIQKFSGTSKYQSYGLRLGQVGPQTGMEEVQRLAHKFAGYEPIFGWENQIPNETVIDFQYQWLKDWRLDPTLSIALSNSAQVGTSSNYFLTGINLRLGKFNDINTSNWLRPAISNSSAHSSKRQTESYIISGFRAKYIMSNIFLEGSLFNNDSPIWVDPRTVVLEGDLGFLFSIKKTSFALIGVFQGKEFEDGKGHFYLNFNIARSF